MGDVFVSYRRDDSQWSAGRINDRLAAALGADRVFFDTVTIEPGADFVEALGASVGKCRVVVAVIGPAWLDILQRRIAENNDFVRIEIAQALKRGVRVVPVLIDGARPPPESALPDDLKSLSRRNAIPIRAETFASDVDRLIGFLRGHLGEIRSPASEPATPRGPPQPPPAVKEAITAAQRVAAENRNEAPVPPGPGAEAPVARTGPVQVEPVPSLKQILWCMLGAILFVMSLYLFLGELRFLAGFLVLATAIAGLFMWPDRRDIVTGAAIGAGALCAPIRLADTVLNIMPTFSLFTLPLALGLGGFVGGAVARFRRLRREFGQIPQEAITAAVWSLLVVFLAGVAVGVVATFLPLWTGLPF
jgi:TIR domain-containing protein